MLANDGVTWPGCQAKNADLTGELGNYGELRVIWVLDLGQGQGAGTGKCLCCLAGFGAK
ncbi:MAG: hypothetical protein BWX66_00329 [Deltaproteobacteria bacterium ADurb.Bin058]|nr:MAG: hypothetical protein BWX66_00329 [Deltaproteobacteria bacterium ADurb.Bin058]